MTGVRSRTVVRGHGRKPVRAKAKKRGPARMTDVKEQDRTPSEVQSISEAADGLRRIEALLGKIASAIVGMASNMEEINRALKQPRAYPFLGPDSTGRSFDNVLSRIETAIYGLDRALDKISASKSRPDYSVERFTIDEY